MMVQHALYMPAEGTTAQPVSQLSPRLAEALLVYAWPRCPRARPVPATAAREQSAEKGRPQSDQPPTREERAQIYRWMEQAGLEPSSFRGG